MLRGAQQGQWLGQEGFTGGFSWPAIQDQKQANPTQNTTKSQNFNRKPTDSKQTIRQHMLSLQMQDIETQAQKQLQGTESSILHQIANKRCTVDIDSNTCLS